MSTKQLMDRTDWHYLSMIFNRDEKHVSIGTIFLDDGISADTVST